MRGYLLKAALNNAQWCNAVCCAQGAPGEFHEALWLNRFGTPAYYPDVVTLTAGEASAEQTAVITSLIESPRGAGWTVKDSFQSLDLRPLGFTVLFDAEWIVRLPSAGGAEESPSGLSWEVVRSEADLMLWGKAWAGKETSVETSRIFAASLISRSDISFLFAPADGPPLCGGILSKGAGVVGLSNVFHAGVDPEIAWRGLLSEAAKRFPGLAIVGYEAKDERTVARGVGFQSAGPLRIWHKP